MRASALPDVRTVKSLAHHHSRSETAVAFQARAARATELVRTWSAGADVLRFAAELFETQASVADALERLHAAEPLRGRLALDGPRMIEHLLDVVRCAARLAPLTLTARARARARENPNTARVRLAICWNRQRARAPTSSRARCCGPGPRCCAGTA
jgi:hypothetical protein